MVKVIFWLGIVTFRVTNSISSLEKSVMHQMCKVRCAILFINCTSWHFVWYLHCSGKAAGLYISSNSYDLVWSTIFRSVSILQFIVRLALPFFSYS